MSRLVKLTQVQAKVETTQGTYETLAGTDYARVMDPSWSAENLTMIERGNVAKNSQGMLPSLYGGSLWGLSVSGEIASGTGTETIPEHDAFFRGAGLSASSLSSYDPPNNSGSGTGDATQYSLRSDSNDMDTISMSYHQDGFAKRIRGARATAFSLDLTTGATAKFSGTYVGKIQEEIVDAAPGMTISAVNPMVVTGAFITIGGVGTFTVEGVQIDFGLTTDILRDMTDPNGFALPRITDRNITLTVSPEKVAPTTKNWWSDLSTDAAIAVSISVGSSRIDGGAGDTGGLDIILPHAKVMSLADGARGNYYTDEVTLQAYTSGSGNNEINFTFS